MLVTGLLALLPLIAAKTIRPGINCNKCLDVGPSPAMLSAPITLNDCNGSATQNWDVSNGDTFIRLAGTEWCIDLGTHRRGPTPGWNPANGEGAKLYPCGDMSRPPAAELFVYDGAKFSLKEKRKGDFCLDVAEGNAGPGANIQMWTCYAGNPNQQWGVL